MKSTRYVRSSGYCEEKGPHKLLQLATSVTLLLDVEGPAHGIYPLNLFQRPRSPPEAVLPCNLPMEYPT